MISLIIPCHNECRNLETLLPYLEKLSVGEAVEIIVCLSKETNDGSGELKDFANVTIRRCRGQGRARQMNEGARMARGEVLAFLHADVRPPTTFFSDIRTALASGYDAGFFSYRFDSDNTLLRINAHFTKYDGVFTGGGDQCLFIRRSTFEALGGFDPDQVIMEDFEFFRRIKKSKTPYTIIPSDLLVSARKYDHNSYLRVNAVNLFLVILFRFGVPSESIKRLHDRLIRSPQKDL